MAERVLARRQRSRACNETMSDWENIFDNLFSGSTGGDDRDTGASVIRRQMEAEKAAASKIFEATLKEIFLAGLPSTARSDFLRSVVENDLWFVPVRDDGSFDVVDTTAGKYRLAIDPDAAGATSNASIKKKKRKKNGKGGRLLPIYAQEPNCPAVRLDGRALVRTIPEDVAGLLFHVPDKSPRELGQEFFADLRELADACDLEDMLLAPGPGQIEKLKQATWLVTMSRGALHLDTTMSDGRLVYAYTHRDRAGYSFHNSSQNVVAMTGEELFRLVAENAEADGIVVNRSSKLGRGENVLNGLALSPGFAGRILEGEDIRPGAQPLPARSREEIELWLNLRLFPWEGRELVEAPYPDHTLIRAVVPQGSQWRMQEALGNQMLLPGPTWSPVFTIPAGSSNTEPEKEPGFGEGSTRILCAGLLAKELNASTLEGKEPERYWRPGRWFLFGQYQDEVDRARSRRRLAIATELAKLLPPGAERIPHSALLTVEGAAFLGEYPHGGSRAWIEATVRQAKRYTKRWVRWD
jgi:hypothetical protein